MERMKALLKGDKLDAVSFRVNFGGDLYHERSLKIGPSFKQEMKALIRNSPLAIPPLIETVSVFEESFPGLPLYAFFETSYFSRLPDDERYYAVPRESSPDYDIKRWGYHGIYHQFNSMILPGEKKIVSVVLDKLTTVCSSKNGNPFSINLGCTPLEGIMARTSSGDIDPGIIFFLMRRHNYSIYRIDSLLKKESGFLGLTGYDLETDKLYGLAGRDEKTAFAFRVFETQLVKSIGEAISAVGGMDAIVFSGAYVESLKPLILQMIRNISFLGISVKPLPWPDYPMVRDVSAPDSNLRVILNTLGWHDIVYSETPRPL
jgi:acetate kinase